MQYLLMQSKALFLYLRQSASDAPLSASHPQGVWCLMREFVLWRQRGFLGYASHRPEDSPRVRAVFEQLLEAIHQAEMDLAVFDLP